MQYLHAQYGCLGVAQVGYSAVVFYGYVGVIGLALWAMMKWWFKSDVTLPQVWCTYGVRRWLRICHVVSDNPRNRVIDLACTTLRSFRRSFYMTGALQWCLLAYFTE